jgi:hypothetical protein
VGDRSYLPTIRVPAASTESTGAEQLGGGVQSLLDVSQLTAGKGKIKLTTQYRVPDIANLLNSRIYKGDYQTAPEQGTVERFSFVHIPGPIAEQKSEKKGRKSTIEK